MSFLSFLSLSETLSFSFFLVLSLSILILLRISWWLRPIIICVCITTVTTSLKLRALVTLRLLVAEDAADAAETAGKFLFNVLVLTWTLPTIFKFFMMNTDKQKKGRIAMIDSDGYQESCVCPHLHCVRVEGFG